MRRVAEQHHAPAVPGPRRRPVAAVVLEDLVARRPREELRQAERPAREVPREERAALALRDRAAFRERNRGPPVPAAGPERVERGALAGADHFATQRRVAVGGERDASEERLSGVVRRPSPRSSARPPSGGRPLQRGDRPRSRRRVPSTRTRTSRSSCAKPVTVHPVRMRAGSTHAASAACRSARCAT